MCRFLVTMVVWCGISEIASAGGPPPVYLIIDRVTFEPSTGDAERITIHGSFVRLKPGPGYEYGAPVSGSMTFRLDKEKAKVTREEWMTLSKVAGTGKVVAVGMCSASGTFQTVTIQKKDDRTVHSESLYTPGHLPTLNEIQKGQAWVDEPPVTALKSFVKESNKTVLSTNPKMRKLET
jgi:hypothetical protein